MNKLIQYCKDHYIDEIRSFTTTFISILAVDGVMQLMAIYNGDLSREAFIALGYCAARSAIKTLLTLCFPYLFPVRSSKVGQHQ